MRPDSRHLSFLLAIALSAISLSTASAGVMWTESTADIGTSCSISEIQLIDPLGDEQETLSLRIRSSLQGMTLSHSVQSSSDIVATSAFGHDLPAPISHFSRATL